MVSLKMTSIPFLVVIIEPCMPVQLDASGMYFPILLWRVAEEDLSIGVLCSIGLMCRQVESDIYTYM